MFRTAKIHGINGTVKRKIRGEKAIIAAFSAAGREGRAALMPYYTLGYPNREVAGAVLHAIAPYCDLIELGVPFSDPLADGPTIQHSTQVALEQGVTPAECVAMVRDLRLSGVDQPVLLMGYYNPVLAYGPLRFVTDAAAAGVDGLIIPDLPLEESDDLQQACSDFGLALVFLAAPNTPTERLARLAAATRGFLYLVSLTGVTGERQELPIGLASFIARAQKVATTPLAVGFGISTPQQVAQVGAYAGGVIVGSALIKTVQRAFESGVDAEECVVSTERFIFSLRQALSGTG